MLPAAAGAGELGLLSLGLLILGLLSLAWLALGLLSPDLVSLAEPAAVEDAAGELSAPVAVLGAVTVLGLSLLLRKSVTYQPEPLS